MGRRLARGADAVRAVSASDAFAVPANHHQLPTSVKRAQIPFRKVNARGSLDYDPTLQRHHLLPRQLLSTRCFSSLFEHIGRQRVGFEDFRSDGLLLPSTEALMRLRLLQIALRRRLLDERKRTILNKKDPLGTGFDFAELDAMAETLWGSTEA